MPPKEKMFLNGYGVEPPIMRHRSHATLANDPNTPEREFPGRKKKFTINPDTGLPNRQDKDREGAFPSLASQLK